MNVLLFLGSGISRPTWESVCSSSDGIVPDVVGLTNSVLSGFWKLNEGVFEARLDGEPPCAEANRCQCFLQRLHCRVFTFYEELRGSVNYEDLFYLVDQLRSTLLNPAIQPFREQMQAACGDLCWRSSNPQGPIAFDDLCSMVCDFIQCVVWRKLRADADVAPQGMDLILDLARKAVDGKEIKRLTICTLNHDLLVEKLLDGIEYADGFAKPNEGGFFSSRNLKEASAPIKLLKLHGSTNWYRYQRREGEDHRDLHACHKIGFKSPTSGGGVFWHRDPIPTILSGSYNKPEAYGLNIFKEFMHAFHSELAESTLMLMSGFGWGDYAINQRLCEWLARGKSQRIILLHKSNPVSMLRMGHVIRNQCDSLIRSRKLLVVRKWLQHTMWDDIKHRIAHMDSLPPCKQPNPTDLF